MIRRAVIGSGYLVVGLVVCGAMGLAQTPATKAKAPSIAVAEAPPPPLDDMRLWKNVNDEIRRLVKETGVPSAQVAVARRGRVVYTEAFGDARLADPAATPPTTALAATSQMHYAIGSISKQFTAACVLLLVEEGKMSLDDPVARWFPDLTRASEVKVRNLLTHTSGYSDYAPQDYTIPLWTQPVSPLALVQEWAGKPLDFDPGTRWQYSNTNFVLAGLIVEKASGQPFWQFLSTRVLKPLELNDVLDLGADRDRMEPRGYMRNALGPLRPAILEAPGWYFADGALAMSARTLARWDVSLIHRTLLQPSSYDAMETEMKLKDGAGTHYGLGVEVRTVNGRRLIAHSGEVGGFVASNLVYPDDDLAVVVLTNQEASSAAGRISRAVAGLLLSKTQARESAANPTEQAKTILAGLQQGRIDPQLFTEDARFYFSKQALGDFAGSLAPLGEVKAVTLESEELRGGMTFRVFHVAFAHGNVRLSTYTMPDGKIEQFLVEP